MKKTKLIKLVDLDGDIYDDLINLKSGKLYTALRVGTDIAIFNNPPSSLEEAKELIDKYNKKMDKIFGDN